MQPGEDRGSGQSRPAKLLRIHIAESDRWDGQPLYEAIVARCRAMKIAGATVLRGLEGFGETADMHRAHLVRHDQPMVVTIVDSEESIARLLPALEPMIDTGLIAISDVQATRVQKQGSE
jgi:uncharacterized protein